MYLRYTCHVPEGLGPLWPTGFSRGRAALERVQRHRGRAPAAAVQTPQPCPGGGGRGLPGPVGHQPGLGPGCRCVEAKLPCCDHRAAAGPSADVSGGRRLSNMSAAVSGAGTARPGDATGNPVAKTYKRVTDGSSREPRDRASIRRSVLKQPVGAENLCHLGRWLGCRSVS
jgi:hypothetical protein